MYSCNALFWTLHNYATPYLVVRLWEQDPAPFLDTAALLPFASLTPNNSPQALLEQVAQRVAKISDIEQRQREHPTFYKVLGSPSP